MGMSYLHNTLMLHETSGGARLVGVPLALIGRHIIRTILPFQAVAVLPCRVPEPHYQNKECF
jgi:hypothetical protein